MIKTNFSLFVLVSVILVVTCGLVSCFDENNTNGDRTRVFILAIDGMDPDLLQGFMDRGLMPNFSKLSRSGSFAPLGTSNPPQSPVAWSNFITGMNPGGHGIYDFIHRLPESLEPYLSTSVSEEPDERIDLGLVTIPNRLSIPFTDYLLPLSGGKIMLMRKGKAFWEYLDEAGINTSIIKIPSNYPPVQAGTRTLSGMGTPDLLGSYGTSSFYTDNYEGEETELSGARVFLVEKMDNCVETKLYGPPNSFREESPDLTIPMTIYIDSESEVAKVVLPDQEIILNQGEWSDWVVVEFEAIPYIQKLSGICKLYLKEVVDNFQLYVSPINVNPAQPAVDVSYPGEFVGELYDKMGYFYTQGMAEDTHALSNGLLDNGEYLTQADFVFQERLKLFRNELNRFKTLERGLTFFYFSSVDLTCHMFWRTMDHSSPAYKAHQDEPYTDVVEKLYTEMDIVLGEAMAAIGDDPNTLLMVMSDHGFAPFHRSFQLNTWLLENGYLVLKDPTRKTHGEYFENVDWTRTRAYGLGLNGLYLNQQGREPQGTIREKDRTRILDELKTKLEAIKDPKGGQTVIHTVFKREDVYSGPYTDQAPDMLVGFNRGYRVGWESALGGFTDEIFADNTSEWSGDHCMAPELVPGIILTNRKEPTAHADLKLEDLAPTILKQFGVPVPETMNGRPLY